jgi:cbb3-type cytochrome oxidase cytochrome c subunit
VVETLPVNQQGPDLIRVGDRIDYAWAQKWISDPKKVDPKTRMTIPQLTPAQVDEVRMFVWKAALEQPASASGGAPAGAPGSDGAKVAAR